MGRTTLLIFQVTNKQNLTREDLGMPKKGKLTEINQIPPNSNQKNAIGTM